MKSLINQYYYIMKDNESWMYGYDVETNAKPSEWMLPTDPKLKNA